MRHWNALAGTLRRGLVGMAWTVLACALTALPVLAETRPGPRADMGRIAHAGVQSFSHCTATRLDGGAILTAAHCLPDAGAREVHLGLGYDRGDYLDLVSATGAAYRVKTGRDVAVLCASAAADGPGLTVSPEVTAPKEVSFWGYGRPYVHILNRKTCNVTTSDARYLVLDCAATPGYSGGPVTVGQPPVLIGIVSRASRTRTVVERLSRADIEGLCPQ